MDRETVGDVPACTVYVQGDRPGVVVRQLPKALDDAPCDVFLDVADEVDVAQPIRRLLPEDALHRINQVADQPIVQVTVGKHVGRLRSFLGWKPFRAYRLLRRSIRALIY